MAETGILGVRSWRQQKGISLESIAASTRLSVRQLAAIEDGDFERLPGGIYNTSYIRQYAQAIGFDQAHLLAYYTEACNPAPALTPVPVPQRSRWSSVLFLHRA
jgi:cytoskeletal protein RodZ